MRKSLTLMRVIAPSGNSSNSPIAWVLCGMLVEIRRDSVLDGRTMELKGQQGQCINAVSLYVASYLFALSAILSLSICLFPWYILTHAHTSHAVQWATAAGSTLFSPQSSCWTSVSKRNWMRSDMVTTCSGSPDSPTIHTTATMMIESSGRVGRNDHCMGPFHGIRTTTGVRAKHTLQHMLQGR